MALPKRPIWLLALSMASGLIQTLALKCLEYEQPRFFTKPETGGAMNQTVQEESVQKSEEVKTRDKLVEVECPGLCFVAAKCKAGPGEAEDYRGCVPEWEKDKCAKSGKGKICEECRVCDNKDLCNGAKGIARIGTLFQMPLGLGALMMALAGSRWALQRILI